jgi:hypothetical protein
VEEQVGVVADCVTDIIQHSLTSKQTIKEKEKHQNAH